VRQGQIQFLILVLDKVRHQLCQQSPLGKAAPVLELVNQSFQWIGVNVGNNTEGKVRWLPEAPAAVVVKGVYGQGAEAAEMAGSGQVGQIPLTARADKSLWETCVAQEAG